jgi:hypothetical protein
MATRENDIGTMKNTSYTNIVTYVKRFIFSANTTPVAGHKMSAVGHHLLGKARPLELLMMLQIMMMMIHDDDDDDDSE